jgi:hypothetical protein
MERALSSDLSLNVDATRAKCKDHPNPDFFFDTVVTRDGEEFADEQKKYCKGCDVLNECFYYALYTDVRGVWGGTSYRERKKLRRQLKIIAEPLEFGDYSGVVRNKERSNEQEQ